MIIPFSPYSPCSAKETFNKLFVISTRLVIIWNLKIGGNLLNNDIQVLCSQKIYVKMELLYRRGLIIRYGIKLNAGKIIICLQLSTV
jgi:hypothetical protein